MSAKEVNDLASRITERYRTFRPWFKIGAVNRREFLAALGVLSQRRFNLLTDEPVVVYRQPYLQNVRTDRATVMWATELPADDAYVAYSADGVSFRKATAFQRTFLPSPDTGLVREFTQHVATLPRLSSNSSYLYYPVVNGSPIGSGARFRTTAPPLDPATGRSYSFRFLVLGDSGMGTASQIRVAQRLNLESASFLLHVGDIAYGNGNFEQFQRNYFDIYRDLMMRTPFFTAPGNHEYDTPNAAPYLSLHTFPTDTVPLADRGRYYSFDWGNVHFVSLDSQADRKTNQGTLLRALSGSSDMLNWLQRDLRSTRQFWKVVFFHHPAYAGGQNYGDPIERDVEQYLCPILESNGVQLVLNGHEHSYQRTFPVKFSPRGRTVPDGTGTVYMTLGGGGATLYENMFPLPQTAFQRVINHYGRVDVEGSRLTLRAINDAGAQFDSVVIAPLPVLADASPVTFDPDPVAGGLVRIRGFNLGLQEMFTQTASPNLAGTSASLNGRPLDLLYVSPTQIVGQLSETLRSTTLSLAVSTPNGTLQFSI